MKKLIAMLCIWLVASPVMAKDPVFTMPRAFHAKTYPAHEAHENEKLAIAVDPYDTADKTAGVFGTDFRQEGLLPILLVFSNDGNQAVSLADMKVVLVTRNRTKITPSSNEDVFRRIAHKREDRNVPIPLPIPLPKKSKRQVSKEAEIEVEGAQFMARAVEPKATRHGFLFFNVQGINNPMAGANLVITGLADGDGNELFYFEIPLEKYLSYQPLKPRTN
ncbi:MAG TPA: hypothetical protein VMZ25_02520 [Terriglobales bacterium]|nr:hypothetical protein [Terriglobales bacterium]